MGRSQVLYNRRHGKQRGGRVGQRNPGHQRQDGRWSELIKVADENSQRFDETSNSSTAFHDNDALEEENLIASFTQAYDNFQCGAGEYGSSHEAAISLMDDDNNLISISSLGVTTSQDDRIKQNNPLQIDSMALAKLLSVLPALMRLNLPEDMGKYLDDALGSGIFDSEKKTLAALKLQSLREAHERSDDEEQRATKAILSKEQNSRSSSATEREIYDDASKFSCSEISLANLNTITEAKEFGRAEATTRRENDEEDLEAWLDGIIS
jgi:hypothetical protein